MKKLLPWLAGLLVIFAIYLYASPYIALYNIKNAAEQKDADKLSGYIDFPSVKQSMKDQVKAAMVEELAASDEQDGFEALGTMLAAAMIDPIIDGVVTPDGVALMLQGQKLDFDLNNDTSEDKPEAKNEDIDYKAGYLSFNRFKVQIIDTDDSDESLDVIMHRDGLSWKVTRISFSLDSKDKKSNKNVEESPVADLGWADEESASEAYDDVFQDLGEQQDTDMTSISDVSEVTSDTLNDDYYNNETGANAVEITGPLTPAQAARIDYLVDNDIETSQDMIDLLNDFTLGGGTEADLRKFVIERSGYEDGYDGLTDCRNPDLTEAQYMNNCT
ncbi:conserved hypothetical protein [Psychrobacter arcticus 273-4]|uniref:DUF2939 domain-containing protein n=1 Tax=Psychrobacter arcticus (strain DSM 17307 / VKM B-2377 / 273-4) TaxID=259536 RepID=Q4FTC9_PSYA2|nr:DUF2939 domain-containing protein [Psychrobacter arcticus]AAZ18729.1 conserved hypothetical protein [Psychrobacter arcticus 273-4]